MMDLNKHINGRSHLNRATGLSGRIHEGYLPHASIERCSPYGVSTGWNSAVNFVAESNSCFRHISYLDTSKQLILRLWETTESTVASHHVVIHQTLWSPLARVCSVLFSNLFSSDQTQQLGHLIGQFGHMSTSTAVRKLLPFCILMASLSGCPLSFILYCALQVVRLQSCKLHTTQ